MTDTEVVADGLVFPESPRWHEGALWFSDQHDLRVCRVDSQTSNVETVVHVPQQPSGLGWAQGRLLVVSMTDRRVLSFEGGRLSQWADLREVAAFHCNDMVVDTRGRAYVGNFGFDLLGRAPKVPASLALVDTDGSVSRVADDLMFPNGCAITRDGRTLLVAETFAARVTSFRINDDGSLSNREMYCDLGGALPDGICLDGEGAVWCACPVEHQVLRVRQGGEITDRVDLGDRQPFACILGGPLRRTLFVCSATTVNPKRAKELREGRIESIAVPVAGAGLP